MIRGLGTREAVIVLAMDGGANLPFLPQIGRCGSFLSVSCSYRCVHMAMGHLEPSYCLLRQRVNREELWLKSCLSNQLSMNHPE